MTDELGGSSVLIVDDDIQNLRLLTAVMERGGLEPRPVRSGRSAIAAALADPPDLVLLDVQMPEMSGVEVCRWFKQDQRLRNIPIIFISGLLGSDDKVEGFRAGGVDYVSKPIQSDEVLARITTHLRLRRIQGELISQNLELEHRITEQVRVVTASQLSTIYALAKLAEARDDDTGHHIERVQAFSRVLAEQMQELRLQAEDVTPAFIETVYQTAPLHDIGKVATPDAVLLKPGKLTAEEYAEMQLHTVRGANTLAVVLERHPDNPFLRMGVQVARSHHERWDGQGYPDRLAGPRIPLAARVLAVADFYDALTSTRCYRPAFSHEKTCALIGEGSGRHFDPDVVTAFRTVQELFPRIRAEMQEGSPALPVGETQEELELD